MTTFSRKAAGLVFAAVALTQAVCGGGPKDRSATSPTAFHLPTPGAEGRVNSSAVGPPLGTATAFAVLGASTVTNTGATLVTGNLGVFPGLAIVGFPPGIVTGTQHSGVGVASGAQADITTAYNNLAGQACDVNLTGQNLGGMTLTPGVYCFNSSAQLTGTLTLDGLGNAGAVWVFQTGSTLTTASASSVVFINSGQSCGAFWQIGSSATLGTGTAFRGNVLALASITASTGASVAGGLFARTGAVTLDTNAVAAVGSCGSVIQPPPPTPLPTVPALPGPAAIGLLAILLAGGAFTLSRR